MPGLAPRRPDVATLACVAGNGRVGSLGDNELLTAQLQGGERASQRAYEEPQGELLINLVSIERRK